MIIFNFYIFGNMNYFMKIIFLLILIAPLSHASIEVVPVLDRTETKGVEYVSSENGQIFAGVKNGQYKVVWDVDIPEDGHYWMILRYRTDGDSHPITLKWEGNKKAITVSIKPQGEFLKIFSGKMIFDKGRQKITLTKKEKDRLYIKEMKLIPDLFPVLSPIDGKIELKSVDSYYELCAVDDNGQFRCISDNAIMKWNVEIPREQRYSLLLDYCTSPYEKMICLEMSVGTNKVLVQLPGTSNFGDYKERQMAFLPLPAGKYPIRIKKISGWMDIRKASLVHSAEQDKKIEALQKKNRLGLDLSEFETLYGKGEQADYILYRRGGREDTDGKIYQGIQRQIESYYWNKPGLIITAAFYKGKCVAVNVRPEKISPNSARELTGILLPETVFEWKRGDTYYSRDKMCKMQYWGDSFDIKASGLLAQLRSSEPAGMAEKESMAALEPGDILMGATLSQLQQLWGEGRVSGGVPEIERQNDKMDKDWGMFLKIKPEASAHRWSYPDKNDLVLEVVFWKERCVSIRMSAKDRLSSAQVMEKVREIVPGCVFGAIPRGREDKFTLYSTSPNKYYKLQGFGDYVELKSPGLVSDIREQEGERLKKAALVLIKKWQSAETSVYGKTVEELDRILGVSKRVSSGTGGKELVVWDFLQSDLSLQCSYSAVNGKNLCDEFIIIDKNKSLTASVALAVGRQLIAPNPVRNMLQEELSSWFTVTSMDKDKRFLLKWYNDKKTGPTLSVTDRLVEKYVEQNRTDSLKKNL